MAADDSRSGAGSEGEMMADATGFEIPPPSYREGDGRISGMSSSRGGRSAEVSSGSTKSRMRASLLEFELTGDGAGADRSDGRANVAASRRCRSEDAGRFHYLVHIFAVEHYVEGYFVRARIL